MTRVPMRLVGRDDDLARLVAAVEHAANGEAAFALVVGEAGIGKSALLARVATEAEQRGLRVLAGSAVETGATIPYLPLIGPLATAVEGNFRDAASVTVRRVVRGEPADDPSGSSLGGDPDRAAAAARFIEAVFDVLVRRPTLLVVDDVHWADRSTATLLDYLSRRATDVPLAIVAAARDDEADATAHLPIADGRRFEQIALRRLGRDEVSEQVAELVGHRPEATLVDSLFERSAGNPLFVEELLGAAGGLQDDGAARPSSAALRSVILGRLGRLSPQGRLVVEALAAVGRPADESMVAVVAALPVAQAEAALDEAIRGGVAVRSGPAGYDLRHPIVGEVAAAAIGPAAGRELHARAAASLEEVTTPGAAAERARHWALAGDDHRAWLASREAAAEAERSFAFAEAAAALARAVDLWPATEPGLVRAELDAAEAAWLSGDAAAALELAERADATDGTEADAVALELAIARGRYLWDVNRRPESVAAFARVEGLLDERTPRATRARARWGIGRALVGSGRPADAYVSAVEGAQLAADAGQGAWEAEAWLLAGMSRVFDGQSGLPELRRGLAVALATGDPAAIGHGYQFIVEQLGLTGSRDEALGVAREGIEATGRVGVSATHGSDLRGHTALLLLDAGRWSEAAATLEPADPRAIPSLARALLAMRTGDFTAAEEALEAASTGGAIGGPGIRGGGLELARAELAWLRDDLSAAQRDVGAIEYAPSIWRIDGMAWRARWESRLGMELSSPSRPPHVVAELEAAIAAEIAAARATSAGHDAADAWSAAADAWTAVDRSYDVGWARLNEAEAGFAAGRRDEARDALHEAARIATDLGAGPLGRRIDDLAKRARVSASPMRRTSPDADALTERERDVLRLLAEGRTNRDIAGALFLSPKTVELHVSRILGKLGAKTRGEAVAVARRKGELTGP